MSRSAAVETALQSSDAVELLSICRPIGDLFAAAGFRLFLVGGSVRDLIDGRSITEPDLDFTTNARPSDTKALIAPIAEALWTQGERFGTIAAHIAGRLVEITTHRAEAYEPDSRKPMVSFSDDIVVDLSRRDFTINALALEVTAAEPELIDPYGGVDDLGARRLATPLTPAESFSDDPLRMMRAARFLARFSLTADADLVDAVEAMAERLDVVSVERVRDEFDKLLVLPDPVPGLWFLVDHGLAERFLEPLTPAVLERVHFDALEADALMRLAAILFAAEVDDVTPAMKRLKSSRQATARVRASIDAARSIHHHQGVWSDVDVRRLVHRRLDEVTAALSIVVAAGDAERATSARAAIDALAAREPLAKMTVPLGGRDIMELLGEGAGPLIGDAMDALIDHRLEVGPLDPDRAADFVRTWAQQR